MSDLIFVEQKPLEGREQTLEAGATIGREGCDVNLMDPEMSRRHAAIRESGGSLAIEDLGSTNGTFVNGERITGVTVLRDGDSVRLGNTVWSIRSTAPAVADVTAAQPVPTGVAGPPSPPAPPPTAAQPAAAEPPSAPAAGPRGDVAAPPQVTPSAIRRVLPPPAPGQAPQFSPPGARPSGSAATRVEATVVAMIIAAVVAALLIVYFVTY